MTWKDPDFEYEQAARDDDRRRRDTVANLVAFVIALPFVLLMHWWLG